MLDYKDLFILDVKAIQSELSLELIYLTDSNDSKVERAFDLNNLFKLASVEPFESAEQITGDGKS